MQATIRMQSVGWPLYLGYLKSEPQYLEPANSGNCSGIYTKLQLQAFRFCDSVASTKNSFDFLFEPHAVDRFIKACNSLVMDANGFVSASAEGKWLQPHTEYERIGFELINWQCYRAIRVNRMASRYTVPEVVL